MQKSLVGHTCYESSSSKREARPGALLKADIPTSDPSKSAVVPYIETMTPPSVLRIKRLVWVAKVRSFAPWKGDASDYSSEGETK